MSQWMSQLTIQPGSDFLPVVFDAPFFCERCKCDKEIDDSLDSLHRLPKRSDKRWNRYYSSSKLFAHLRGTREQNDKKEESISWQKPITPRLLSVWDSS